MTTDTQEKDPDATVTTADIIESSGRKLAEKLKAMEEYARNNLDRATTLNHKLVIWWTLKEAYKEIDASRKKIYHLLDEYDKAVLPALFEKENEDLKRIPSLGRSFYPTPKFSAKIVDRDAAFEWLRSNELGDLIQETINAGTLSTAIKTMLDEKGEEPPTEIIQINTYNTIGSSKYTPKDK